MTDERKAIVRGITNAVKVYNKVWKKKEAEEDLVVFFGQEENVTKEEALEILKELS